MQYFAPYGMQPVNQDQAAQSYYRNYPNALPAAGSNFNLFAGQPITFNQTTGYIEPITATTQQIGGVFGGVEYFDPTAQTIVSSLSYKSGQTFQGFMDPTNQVICRVLISDVDNTNYKIQATGPFTGGQAPVLSQFNLDLTTETVTQPDGSTFPFVGNTTPLYQIGSFFGNSYASLNPAEVTTADAVGQLICVGNFTYPGNYLTDPFPIVLVKANSTFKSAALAV